MYALINIQRAGLADGARVAGGVLENERDDEAHSSGGGLLDQSQREAAEE